MSLIDIYTLDLNYAAHAALIDEVMIMTEKVKKQVAKKVSDKKASVKKTAPETTKAPKKTSVKKPVAPKKATDKPEQLAGISIIQKLATATAEIVKNNPPKTDTVTVNGKEDKTQLPLAATGSSFERTAPFLKSTGPASVPMPPTAVQVRKERTETVALPGDKITMSELMNSRKTNETPKARRPKYNFKFR